MPVHDSRGLYIELQRWSALRAANWVGVPRPKVGGSTRARLCMNGCSQVVEVSGPVSAIGGGAKVVNDRQGVV